MQVVNATVLGQVVGDSVDGEGAVGDAVGHSADGAAEVGVVVDEVVVDVVEAERHDFKTITRFACFRRLRAVLEGLWRLEGS